MRRIAARRARTAIPFAFILAALASTSADAQAVLKGRIRAAQSQAPLALVEVLIDELKKREWTNDSGDFRISGLPIGTHELRIRRVGFESAVATLKIESADSLSIDLSLNAWVPELETILRQGAAPLSIDAGTRGETAGRIRTLSVTGRNVRQRSPSPDGSHPSNGGGGRGQSSR